MNKENTRTPKRKTLMDSEKIAPVSGKKSRTVKSKTVKQLLNHRELAESNVSNVVNTLEPVPILPYTSLSKPKPSFEVIE
jgi:hypothetical protein